MDWVGHDAAVGVKINSAPENDGDFDYRVDTSTHDWFFISAADANKSQYWNYAHETATLSNVSIMYLWCLDYSYAGFYYTINGGADSETIQPDYTDPEVVTFSGDSTIHFVLYGD